MNKEQPQKDSDIPIGGYFKLNPKKKLGSGAFGEIYLGMNTKRHEPVAIKLEQIKTKHPQLLYESKLYTALQGGGTILNLIISFSWNSEYPLVRCPRQFQHTYY